MIAYSWARRPSRWAGAVLSCVLIATLGFASAPPPARGQAPPDIPIVWRAAGPPNFWLCAVGLHGGAGAHPSMQLDAINIEAALIGQPGYAAARRTLVANQDGVLGTGDDPNLARHKRCVRKLKSAAAGDVVVFFIATHGVRNDGTDNAPADEPALEEQTQYTAPGGTTATDEGFVLLDGTLSDDAFAALWKGMPAGVRVIAIFDHCFSGGHADGKKDLAAMLGNQRALLMSIERQMTCYDIEPKTFRPGFPRHLRPGHVDPYAPGAQLQAGVFTNYLRKGLALVPNGACVGGQTTRADASAANYGLPAGNNDCVTTGVEVFNYVAQRTVYLVADDDLDDARDEDESGPPILNEDGDAWPGAVGAGEIAENCRDLQDDDGDNVVNDGCSALFPAPAGEAPEIGPACSPGPPISPLPKKIGINDDWPDDEVIDDGCGIREGEDDPVNLDFAVDALNGEDPPEFVIGVSVDNDKDGLFDEDGLGAHAKQFNNLCPPLPDLSPDECRQYPKVFTGG